MSQENLNDPERCRAGLLAAMPVCLKAVAKVMTCPILLAENDTSMPRDRTQTHAGLKTSNSLGNRSNVSRRHSAACWSWSSAVRHQCAATRAYAQSGLSPSTIRRPNSVVRLLDSTAEEHRKIGSTAGRGDVASIIRLKGRGHGITRLRT